MDHAQMCRLVIGRHHKLRALRQQAANDNQKVKRLFMGALRQLLLEQPTQQAAFDQISQLIATASPILAKSLAEQILPHIKAVHTALEEHCLFWARALDGSLERQGYPNFKGAVQKLKIRNEQRELSPKFMEYLREFQSNWNQLHDERVQFFEDFDDDTLSESMDNDSRIEEIIFLNIMQLKIARNKLEKQKLTEQALAEQVNKIRYFITLRPPAVLTDSEKRQYEKQLGWAKHFLANQQQQMRKNPSLSINQTFNISLDEQNIEIIDKKEFEQRRKLKEEGKVKQIFTDSVDMRSQMQKTNKNAQKSKAVYKTGNPNVSSKAGNPNVSSKAASKPSPQQEFISPIKHISDARYVSNLGQSMDSDLSIRNDDKVKMQVAHLRSQMEQEQEEDDSELVVRKYKQPPKDQSQSRQQDAKPRDFSVTQNYFNQQGKKVNQALSPKSPQTFKSQTMKQWKRSEYMSPGRNSKCKLSQFTSNKKQRKQLVPRQRITLPQEYAISPYLSHFTSVAELNKFRRDCFQRSFALFACNQLIISCVVMKEVNTEIRLQILFTNNSNLPLQVQNIYKVPKCFHIQKKSKISRKFTLHTILKHVFTLDVQEFPLEACLLNIKYRSVSGGQKLEVVVPLPITILNFVEYLHTSEAEWVQEWSRLTNGNNKQLHYIARHLQVDRQVIPEQFDWILKEYFVHAGAVQGYSVQDFGSSCYYSSLNGVKFLLKVSVRVDNIISLQGVSCRPVNENEQDFMRYIINIWMMLLSKLYF